jgi:abortive infection bacteriophage resistance protein
MKYTKQPIDFPQQLELLKQRGLFIENDNEALRLLYIIIP